MPSSASTCAAASKGWQIAQKERFLTNKKMDISAVNDLPYEDFVDIFGNVVEKCPLVSAAVWTRRPFVGLNDLEAAINHFIDALPEPGEVY